MDLETLKNLSAMLFLLVVDASMIGVLIVLICAFIKISRGLLSDRF